MIAPAPLPDFDIAGQIDAPLPDAAVEAIAALLLDLVDQDDEQSQDNDADLGGRRQ